MNYRHGFHAGNFADVWKHLALVLCLDHLRLKPTPFRVLDVFAGAGVYDLTSDEAVRSPEWQDGIGRLRGHLVDGGTFPAPVSRFLEAVDAAVGAPELYPGSPALIAAALRPADRAIVCDLHPQEAAKLSERLGRRRGLKVETRDGWTAIRALLPPPERRGLLLVDPPFEVSGEFDRLAKAASDALDRFATGTVILWHADKDRAATAGWRRDLARMDARLLVADLAVDEPAQGRGLVSAGLSILNPPHTLEADLRASGGALLPLLARGPGAGFRIERLSGRW